MRQRIINARVTFHNSPIHVLERFAIRDVGDAYEQFSGCTLISTSA